jgi:general secretion pathway protein B
MPARPPLSSQPPVVALLPGGRSAPPPATAAPAAEPASDPVRPWASLPEASRAALPPLAWSGVVYAERAEQRLVVVNGQVAREGDVLGAGLQLLQIRPKSVLLRWQGQRIEMPM